MKTLHLVSLMGEQPIPNLLPILHLKPESVLLVRTPFTKKRSLQLANVLDKHQIKFEFLDVSDGYDLIDTYKKLVVKITDLGWGDKELMVNFTGGTKVMSSAAFLYATNQGLPLIYFQTQGKQSLLHRYYFTSNDIPKSEEEILPPLIDLDDYLMSYLPNYQEVGYSKRPGALTDGGKFEQQIHQILQSHFETKVGVKPEGVQEQLEIDFVIRYKNQVGVIEAKTGKSARKKTGIDQLNTIGGRDYLGTYTQKFLVTDNVWEENFELRAVAESMKIQIIELPSFGQSRTISEGDGQKLLQAIKQGLGG